MRAPLLEGLFQCLKELLGQSGILARPDHPLDQGHLLGHTPLTLSNMLIRFGEVFTFLLQVGHGSDDDAPDYARREFRVKTEYETE
jgi:hypothetical protein